VLVAHGRAVKLLRTLAPRARISLVVNAGAAQRRSDSDVDRRAEELYDLYCPWLFLDPVLRGGYDPVLEADLRRRGLFPQVEKGDFEAIHGALDSVGLNYYSDNTVWGNADGSVGTGPGPGNERTSMGWTIWPEGLRQLLAKAAHRYPGVPLYITENGSAWDDHVTRGQVNDQSRVDYLEAHLREAQKAIAAGVPLKGYYAWSLLDNFEWAEGYAKRFGLIHVDFATQQRIIKKSGHRYAQIIKDNGV
jgi:beta-glucosidase